MVDEGEFFDKPLSIAGDARGATVGIGGCAGLVSPFFFVRVRLEDCSLPLLPPWSCCGVVDAVGVVGSRSFEDPLAFFLDFLDRLSCFFIELRALPLDGWPALASLVRAEAEAAAGMT